MNNLQNNKRTLAGFILVLIGSFFLLRNFDLLPFFLPFHLLSWQAVFILIGLFMIVNRPDKNRGFILIGIGMFSILTHLFHLPMAMVWPFILVIIGVTFIFRAKYKSSI